MLFIFDMGGVVTSTFRMDSIYEKLNIRQEDFFAVCRMNDNDIWHRLECGAISSADFWNEFNQRIGKLQRTFYDGIIKIGDMVKFSSETDIQKIPPVRHDLFRLHFHPQLNTQTAALVAELRKKHRVVCGTNTIQSHWENHIERGDYAFFDQTYASNKIGAAKPDADFFQLILDAENCTAEETFFTDDKAANCDAARSLGINAVQFTDAGQLRSLWAAYL